MGTHDLAVSQFEHTSLPLDDRWGIVKYLHDSPILRRHSSRAFWYVYHACNEGRWRICVEWVCPKCKLSVPDEVKGFLMLCKNTNVGTG